MSPGTSLIRSTRRARSFDSFRDQSPELWSDLKKLLWFQDEPVHTMTAVVGYQLMRLAASHGIRVVLNGQGADETIGGYSSYFQDYWVSLIRQGRMGDAWRAINGYSEAHGGSAPQRFGASCRPVCFVGNVQIPAYRDRAQARRQARLHSNSWFTHELLSHVTNGESELPMGTLSHALKQSVISAPLPLYLRIEDRNSMAHSVEARLPFLDYRLVSLSVGCPTNGKFVGHGISMCFVKE